MSGFVWVNTKNVLSWLLSNQSTSLRSLRSTSSCNHPSNCWALLKRSQARHPMSVFLETGLLLRTVHSSSVLDSEVFHAAFGPKIGPESRLPLPVRLSPHTGSGKGSGSSSPTSDGATSLLQGSASLWRPLVMKKGSSEPPVAPSARTRLGTSHRSSNGRHLIFNICSLRRSGWETLWVLFSGSLLGMIVFKNLELGKNNYPIWKWLLWPSLKINIGNLSKSGLPASRLAAENGVKLTGLSEIYGEIKSISTLGLPENKEPAFRELNLFVHRQWTSTDSGKEETIREPLELV